MRPRRLTGPGLVAFYDIPTSGHGVGLFYNPGAHTRGLKGTDALTEFYSCFTFVTDVSIVLISK